MKQDPLALAFFGAALALLAGLLLYVFFLKTPEPATPARAFPFVEELRRQIGELTAKFEDKPATKPAPPAAKKPAPPAVQPERTPAAPTPAGAKVGLYAPARVLPAGITWIYRVSVEPPAWRDAELIYRTVQQGAGIVVHTEFRHSKGKMNFNLGTFEAGHPSHANVRFPGFFMHPAYFKEQLQVGQKLAWEWPWQLPNGEVRPGRIKRYEGTVVEWVNDVVPSLGFGIPSVRIDTVLSYIEDGRVQATAREILWYAPKVRHFVKVVREGGTPDEGVQRIVAELTEYPKE